MAITVLGRVIEIMPSGRGRFFPIFFLSIKQVEEKTRGTNQNAIRSVLFFLVGGRDRLLLLLFTKSNRTRPWCECITLFLYWRMYINYSVG
jgi:hypothetical protein